jgi:hypothetical protein
MVIVAMAELSRLAGKGTVAALNAQERQLGSRPRRRLRFAGCYLRDLDPRNHYRLSVKSGELESGKAFGEDLHVIPHERYGNGLAECEVMSNQNLLTPGPNGFCSATLLAVSNPYWSAVLGELVDDFVPKKYQGETAEQRLHRENGIPNP